MAIGREDRELDHVPWNELARRITIEKDPGKMLQLCRKLDEVMLAEERKKVAQRFAEKRGAAKNGS